jgi:hypothetical protein
MEGFRNRADFNAKQKIRRGPDMTAKDFAQEVDSVNFLQCKPTDRLITSFIKNYRTPIPIGFESNLVYRLVPNQYWLLAHDEIFQDGPDRSLLPRSFLGFNTTGQPREPTPANRQKPNPSGDDADPPGFVFFQLGVLERAWLKRGEQGWPADEASLYWDTTEFSLVARVGPDGKADGIYAVYNVFQQDIHAGTERYLVEPGDFAWGTPPAAWADSKDEYDHFGCARVGNRLSDFGKRHHMVWTDKIRQYIELVRVFLSPRKDRLYFGKDHWIVSTDEIKLPIESDQVLGPREDRLDSGNQHHTVCTDKIKDTIKSDQVLRSGESRVLCATVGGRA